MTGNTRSKVFVRGGEPVGLIGGEDGRRRREGDALVVLPDERWGNPVCADAALDECDFHIHARLTLDRLAGTGASVLLGGHYHYSHSRPEGNQTFRICLDEDIDPAYKSLDKDMRIVHGMANPLKKHWGLTENLPQKQVVGASRRFIRPGEPFALDIYRRGEELAFEINSRVVFRIDLNEETRLRPGRGGLGGDTGWPISFGFLPGHGTLRIHDFSAEGAFPTPAFPTADAWRFNSGGYSHYRIPSLCLAPSGRLLAFAEARRARLSRTWEWENALVKDEVHCVMKSSDDNGQTWSEQKVFLDYGVSYEPRSPSPVMDRETGEIFLFTKGGPWVVSTRDEGQSWSEPRSLADAAPGEFNEFNTGVGNCAIQLQHGARRGRLLAALYTKNVIGLIFSDDHGKTWQPGALNAFHGACEPSIVECADGRVLVSPRVHRGGPRAPGRLFMISNDGGASFAETHYEPAIPMPRQGELVACEPLDIAGLGSVRPIVFAGFSDEKTRLTLMVSLDDGRTWPVFRVVDDSSIANLALVALPGGQVGVLYERDKYRRLSFQRIDLAWLIGSSL